MTTPTTPTTPATPATEQPTTETWVVGRYNAPHSEQDADALSAAMKHLRVNLKTLAPDAKGSTIDFEFDGKRWRAHRTKPAWGTIYCVSRTRSFGEWLLSLAEVVAGRSAANRPDPLTTHLRSRIWAALKRRVRPEVLKECLDWNRDGEIDEEAAYGIINGALALYNVNESGQITPELIEVMADVAAARLGQLYPRLCTIDHESIMQAARWSIEKATKK